VQKLKTVCLAAALLWLAGAGAPARAGDDRGLCVNHCENAYVLDALECRSYLKGRSHQRCSARRERRYEVCTERCDRDREECRAHAATPPQCESR
jgi:hypothetical protein